MHLTYDELMGQERIPRLTLLNAISGYKTAALIGTASPEGRTNLAIFNQIVHIGANPPYLALVMRPLTVPRHTYTNLKATGHWTINHVHPEHIEAAHQTSADYPEEVSEFDACGFTPVYSAALKAPYVQESRLRIGLEYVEEYPIAASGVVLVVGRIVELFLPDGLVAADGMLDLEQAGIVATGGLDAYYTGHLAARLPYARVK
jgi:flavin reductase (DIM6/NTAB) family NADH-FMN oxidoreductase RutF